MHIGYALWNASVAGKVYVLERKYLDTLEIVKCISVAAESPILITDGLI